MKKRILAAFLTTVIALGSLPFEASAANTSQKLYTGNVTKSEVSLKAELHTNSYSWGNWYTNWNWNSVSPISDYIDNEGRYTIAYTDGKTVYVSHCAETKGSMRIEETVKFAQPMEVLGGVVGDDKGNIYVACGQTDEADTGKICTFAIYKYSSDGKYIGKAEYYPDDKHWSTKIPFDAGNCVMTFQGELLICSYAREMYSGHQSNAVFCVDTVTMKEKAVYDSYCSHSFNQSVLTIDDNTVVFADHGDAYPRGFTVNVVKNTNGSLNGHNNKGYVPFHFSLSGDSGDMFNVNYTNSRLTGIAELESGIALVGSSGDYETESPQQLFLQIIDPDNGNQVLNGATRKGTSASPYGGAYTDTGILWLTDYKDGSEVRASAAAALDEERLLVMWEKWDKNGSFVDSYYSIVSSDGKLLVDSVSLKKSMINGAEELDIIGEIAYWTYADGNGKDAVIYRLDTSSYSTDTISDADITLSKYDIVYTGKTRKPAVTVKYNGVTLKNGTDYTVSYKNNKYPGIGTVTVKGKGKYDGTQTVQFIIRPKAATKFSANRTTSSKNTLTWKKVTKATGYEIEIARYSSSDGWYYYMDKQVIRTTSKTKYVHTAGNKKNVIFMYRVRPFVKVNGEKIYGEWTDYINPYWD